MYLHHATYPLEITSNFSLKIKSHLSASISTISFFVSLPEIRVLREAILLSPDIRIGVRITEIIDDFLFLPASKVHNLLNNGRRQKLNR